MRSRDAYKKSERTHLGIRTRTAARGRIRPIPTLPSHFLQVVRVRDGHRRRRFFRVVLGVKNRRATMAVSVQYSALSSRTTQLK